jgi:hypothetical protein
LLTEREKAAFLIALFQLEDQELAEVATTLVNLSQKEWRQFYEDFDQFIETLEHKLEVSIRKRKNKINWRRSE